MEDSVRLDQIERENAKLRYQVERLETMLSTVNECFKIVDSEYRLVDMNQTGLALIGASSIDDVSGLDVRELLLPQYRAAFEEGIQKALSGSAVSLEFEIEGLSGVRRWMHQEAIGIPSAEAGVPPTQVAAFTRDITNRKTMILDLESAKLELERAVKMKTAFFANMSHEVRTPLTAMLGNIELLLAGDVDTTSAYETMWRCGSHLLNLVDDVLLMTKIDAEAVSLHPTETDPVAIMNSLALMIEPALCGQQNSLRLEVMNTVPATIEVDEFRLRQVLLNLLSNANKFCEKGHVSISVSYSSAHDRVEYQISDTGIGMTEEQLLNISNYKPFVQANEGTTRRYGGTGLGLSITNQLVKLMGGVLSVKSTDGEGTTVAVTLPAVGPVGINSCRPGQDSRRPTGMSSDIATSGAGLLAGKRVLVAEDGVDNQVLIRAHLVHAGAEVVVVHDGHEVVNAIVNSNLDAPVDLVLMDMQMPNIDGYRATSMIRESGFSRPIIALTAYAMVGDRERCISSGCNDYLTKPFTRMALLDKCTSWIAVDDVREAG